MINEVAEIAKLLRLFESSQYNFKPRFELIRDFPVITRDELRRKPMAKGRYSTSTSGSTGEPVTVEKTTWDHIWFVAANIREMRWRGWDFSKDKAVIKPDKKGAKDMDSWGLPPSLFPSQGRQFFFHYATIDEIQAWLESKNPHYLHCAPSIVSQLDLSRVPNLIDVKGTGELGASSYSSEECGVMALQCPHSKDRWHVMENQLVERDEDGGIIVTTMTNPYIRRYKHGDLVDLGACECGRTLQTITAIHGRVRNMYVTRSGGRRWPLIGSRTYHERYGIRRFQAVQTAVGEVELRIVCDPLGDEAEARLREEVASWLEDGPRVTLRYVDGFPSGKFEEFVSEVAGGREDRV